jgi:hypothetical protein
MPSKSLIMSNLATIDTEALINDAPILEEADLAQLDEAFPESEPISYSGADFDVEGLVRRLERKDIIVPTFGHGDTTVEAAGFQRDFVWRKAQMDRFVESLLLGYPVPGIFLVQQRDRRYLVLDGQQRLRTLAHFYDGVFGDHVFALENVTRDLQGMTYKTLSETQRRTLDNTFIQAIVVKTDGTPASLEAIYQIFERLNSGGTQLTGHEIRVALYAGQMIDWVAGLNRNAGWRILYGPPSPRLRDQELILRIVALFVAPGTYERPLKKFLNEFAGAHRDGGGLDMPALAHLFSRACEALLPEPGSNAFRHTSRQVNVAMTEAIMVGLMRRLEVGAVPTSASVAAAIESLKQEPAFINAITRATADEENVKTRLGLAAQELARA